MINVLIVDDHDLVRHGIRKLLEEVSDINVVGEADSGEQAFEMTAKYKPDVVLMDVKMPGMGGMEATKRLLHSYPKMKILALTSCVEEPFPSRVMEAGAQGYVTKGTSRDETLKAVRAVAAGQVYICTEVAQKMAASRFGDKSKSPFDSLSERELQVTVMITSGVKVSEISEKLHLSSKTINSYRYRIFEKLNITSDVDLTLMAIRYGLIESLHGD